MTINVISSASETRNIIKPFKHGDEVRGTTRGGLTFTGLIVGSSEVYRVIGAAFEPDTRRVYSCDIYPGEIAAIEKIFK